MLKPMKLSIDDIPPEWVAALRQKALDAGYKSVGEYMRNVIAALIQREYEGKSWGGARPGVADEDEQEGEESEK